MASTYKNFFRGKKITVMGLGLLGRGGGDVKFLAEGDAPARRSLGAGGDLIVTDLKTKEQLKNSIAKLKRFKNIKFVLGKHRLADFRHRDLIIKAAGVPLDSPYLAETKKQGIPIEMSTALFAKLASGVTVVGVTGTRGKTTTTQLIYEVLKQASPRLPSTPLGINRSGQKNSRIFLGGNIQGVSTLAFLPKVRPGDIAVLELDSWQLQGFGESKLSPHIAVFTNFLPDHLNYYGNLGRYWEDKANIFKYQTEDDYLILGSQFKSQKAKFKIAGQKSKVIIVNRRAVPKSWKIKLLGEHNLNNIALAIKTAEILGVPRGVIKKTVEHFRSVPGRLELIRVWRGIKIYNDTTATTPDATIAALRAVGQPKKKNIILLAGGADKNLDMTGLIRAIPKYCKALILLPGTGSAKFKAQSAKYPIKNLKEVRDLKGAVSAALTAAKRGDIVLFSPGFASFGLFKNEYDRGERFVKLVKRLPALGGK